MTDLQSLWLGIPVYAAPTIIYHLTHKPWSRENQAFYEYLERNAPSAGKFFFPSGKAQWIFPVAWFFMFWALLPVAGIFFWNYGWQHAHPWSYSAGLASHWMFLIMCLGWMNVFFERHMTRFGFGYTLVQCIFLVLALIFSIINAVPVAWALYIVMCVWMLYALISTGIAAFNVPPVHDFYKKSDGEGAYGHGYSYGGYEQVPAPNLGMPPVPEALPIPNQGMSGAAPEREDWHEGRSHHHGQDQRHHQHPYHHHQQQQHPQRQYEYAQNQVAIDMGGGAGNAVASHQQQQQQQFALPAPRFQQQPQSLTQFTAGGGSGNLTSNTAAEQIASQLRPLTFSEL